MEKAFNLDQVKKELTTLAQAFGSSVDRLKETKAYSSDSNHPVDCPCCKHSCNMAENFYYGLDSLRQYIYRLESAFYDYTYAHNKGHLPPIKGAQQMEKALKAIGADGDYEIIKPYISTASESSTPRGKVLEVEFKKG
jgi:hypothetical protein